MLAVLRPCPCRARSWLLVACTQGALITGTLAAQPPAAGQVPTAAPVAAYTGPIIDVHLHGYRAEWPRG